MGSSIVFLGIIFLLAFTSLAYADYLPARQTQVQSASFQQEPLTHFTLGTGAVGYYFVIDSKVTSDGSGIGGDEIDFIDDLEMDKKLTTPDFALPYTINNRNKVRLSYKTGKYKGVKGIDTTFTFKGDTYIPTMSVESKYAFDIVEFTYGYGIMRKDRFGLDLLVGIGYINDRLTLDTDNFGQKTSKYESIFPILGLDYTYYWKPKWDINFLITQGFLGSSTNKLSLCELKGSLIYKMHKNWTISGSYRFSFFDAKRWGQEKKFYRHGPSVTLNLHF
ncbi:MAG: hypothetical protein AB1472_07015 [Candidatus Omnitrophota bacterium]